MPVYNKLVRDQIPAIIIQSGKTLVTRVLSNEEYVTELKRKMYEELAEYEEAINNEDQLEELADLLELVHSAARTHGASPADLESIRASKAEIRGGFDDCIYLIEVEDD